MPDMEDAVEVAEGAPTTITGNVDHAAMMLRTAADARKCWACGCLRHALDTIDRASLRESNTALNAVVAAAREHLLPQRYECLGCDTCFPAVALNDLAAAGVLSEHAACPTDAVEERHGWPPLPGSYTVLRYHAPVAVCTLNDDALAKSLARTRTPELAIVGTLHTENLGIERIVSNVIANPHIRFVVLCGADGRQAIGHLPGQSLMALGQNGVDDHRRIIGAKGKRPVLRNLSLASIEHFRTTREVIDIIGVSDLEAILTVVRNCGARDPGVVESFADSRVLEATIGRVPARMVSDPAGYFVIFPDKARRTLSLEHYANTGVLTAIIEGRVAAELYMTAIDRSLVSRLDHAAYLGRELARAERALISGEPYVQDAAPETASAADCGCTVDCGPANPKLCGQP